MNLQNQIIALWIVVLLLIGYILFLQQRRSYFVPPVGNVITMMDLQEYSYLSDLQKNKYRSFLTSNAAEFTSAAAFGPVLGPPAYSKLLSNVLSSSFNLAVSPTTGYIPASPPTTPFRIQSTTNTSNYYGFSLPNINYIISAASATGNTFTAQSVTTQTVPPGLPPGSAYVFRHTPTNIPLNSNFQLIQTTPVPAGLTSPGFPLYIVKTTNDPPGVYRIFGSNGTSITDAVRFITA